MTQIVVMGTAKVRLVVVVAYIFMISSYVFKYFVITSNQLDKD